MNIRTITTNSPEYSRIVALRDEVLRRPLGLSIYNDDLSKDEAAIILMAVEEEEITGCVILQPQEEKDVLRLRGMAVAEAHRRAGVGRRLVAAAEEAALQYGASEIILHARQVVLPFYRKLGYMATGPSFTEVGIPHLLMQKSLSV